VSLNRERYSLRANWNYRSHQRRAAIAAGQHRARHLHLYGRSASTSISTARYTLTKRFALFAALRNIGDAPDDIQIYGPSTPEVAQFRQRIEFGSLWTFGIKGTF
jgi:hypothetical protein